jgi:hypothetical protein
MMRVVMDDDNYGMWWRWMRRAETQLPPAFGAAI